MLAMITTLDVLAYPGYALMALIGFWLLQAGYQGLKKELATKREARAQSAGERAKAQARNRRLDSQEIAQALLFSRPFSPLGAQTAQASETGEPAIDAAIVELTSGDTDRRFDGGMKHSPLPLWPSGI